MLTGDTGIDPYLPGDEAGQGSPGGDPGLASSSDTLVETGAEGEDTAAQDLVAFAKALTAAGVNLYTAVWCPACNQQRALFEDGADFLPSIEVTNPDRTLNAIGVAENITVFPTWEFPDGSRETGVVSLATIAQRSGVAIPTSVSPSIAPIADTTLYGGSPLHIGLDGYDPNGGPLTYTVVSSNPSLVQASVLSGDRSARIAVTGWGDMVFYLFESRVPDATGRFITLAEADFYDAANNTTPIRFHRVIDNFVAQFGDPTGTGSGGSTLGDFDDDFHPDLQHNTKGALSWAKSTDDTNDSQVFITDVPTRYLDFNHSYFGQLTEGNYVRDGITGTATDSSNRPTTAVTLDSVTIFQDIENGMLMLKAAEGASGSADISVTVTDSAGNQFVEIFHVTVTPDTYNGGPYLADIPTIHTTANTPATFTLSAIDVEGDAVTYSGVKSGSVNYTFSVNSQTGAVTVTPPTGYIGTMQLLVRVKASGATDTADTYDSQLVTIEVAPAAPSGVDLASASDSGFSNTDNLTNLNSLTFDVLGVTSGATVRLYQGSTLLGQATASGTSVSIATSGLSSLADGTYAIHATQEVGGAESGASSALNITLDRTAPAPFSSTPPETANVGAQLSYDAQNAEEGTTGARYSLVNGPTGASLNTNNGVLTWTPTGSQMGTQAFSMVMTDAAGNTRSQDLSVAVAADALMVFRLAVTDINGTALTSVDVGDEFLLQVFVQDLRAEAFGVFAAYLDVLYSQQLVSVDGVLNFGSSFLANRTGNTDTAGLVDEAGAWTGGFLELGSGEFLLWNLQMEATQAGTATFTADFADAVPASQVLLSQLNTAVPAEDIAFGSVSLVINPAFDVNNDTFTVAEDSGSTSLNPLANDQFHQGSTGQLTITAVGATNHGGTVTIATDGKTVNYTPAANFFGTETFTYTASDGAGEKSGTVTVTVTAVNDDPTAVNDTFTVAEDAVAFTLNVLANDLIAPDSGETLQVLSFTTPSAGGTLSIPTAKNSILYTPADNFFGTDTFTYTISDGNGGTSTATVSVTVTEANDPPTAQDDAFTVAEDSTGTTLNVLANDSTQGDTGETLTIVSVTPTNHGGTVTIAGNGQSLTYTPAANYFGTELFQYTINDGHGGTAQASVVITVTPVNDPPTATNDALTAVKNSTAVLFDVLANDSSQPDASETLTISAVGTPSAGGTVTIAQTGAKVQYTPATGFSGTETFTYTVRDPSGATAVATVTVTVSDYIPSKLSGYSYLDVDNNGVKGSNESPLGSVVMTLSGTDQAGTAVNLTTSTDAHGFYQFINLAPGTYKIKQTQPAMLIDGIDSGGTLGTVTGADELTVNLAQNVDGQSLNFGERGRQAAYISVVDFFASTPRESVVATASTNGSSQWYAIEGGWSHANTLSLALQSNQTSAELEVVTSDAQEYTTMLNLRSPEHVQRLGASGTMQVLRIVGAPAKLFPDADCAACGEGEGEFAVNTWVSDDDAERESDWLPGTPADGYRATELIMAQEDALEEITGPPAERWVAQDNERDYVVTIDRILAAFGVGMPLD